jgi:AbiV family abortive infection protein
MKPKKPLTQYVGPLSPKQAAEGIAAAYDTALALVQDAELLVEHGRWPRAVALAALAIEEAGKANILRGLLLARTEEERRDDWRDYRSHTKKNVAYILPELVSDGARSLDDLDPLVDPNSDHGQLLDTCKQLAFYSEAVVGVQPCNWSTPAKTINEAFARSLVATAKIFASGEHAMTSEAELELWVRHLRPVWKVAPAYEVKQAMAACYAEAEATGVLRGKHTAREMTRFLFGITGASR